MNPRNENIIAVVAINVRNQRKIKNLTIVQLAELCGVEPITISRIERKISNPTVSTLFFIAEALQIDIGLLLQD